MKEECTICGKGKKYGILFDTHSHFKPACLARKAIDSGIKGMERVVEGNFTYTTLASIASVPLIAGYTGENSILPQVIASTVAMGAIADGIRYIDNQHRIRSMRTVDNPLIRALEEEYFDGLIDVIRKEYNLNGSCHTLIADRPPRGTAIFKGGYHSFITLKFDDGKVDLMYKYVEDQDTSVASHVTAFLRSHGQEWVPRVFFPEFADTYQKSKRSIDRDTLDTNKSLNRGTFYELVDGKSLEERVTGSSSDIDWKKDQENTEQLPFEFIVRNIIKKMSWFYDSEWESGISQNGDYCSVKHDKFHTTLQRKLRESNYDTLANSLNEAHQAITSGRRNFPIHGDLHQGNVLGAGEHIIDWDNAQYGNPYHDFLHFSFLTDFDSHPKFNEVQREFGEMINGLYRKSNGNHPNSRKPISTVEASLIGSEILLSLLDRYNSVLQSGGIQLEYEPNMALCCKNLLVRTGLWIENTAKEIEPQFPSLAKSLIKDFEDYAANANLENIPYNPKASIAYAHRVNQLCRKINAQEKATRNRDAHTDITEKLVITNARINTGRGDYPPIYGVMLAVASLYIVPDMYYGNVSPEVLSIEKKALFSDLLPTIGLITVGYYAHNNIGKLIRGCKRAYKGIRNVFGGKNAGS